jgi:hypothetical protein
MAAIVFLFLISLMQDAMALLVWWTLQKMYCPEKQKHMGLREP